VPPGVRVPIDPSGAQSMNGGTTSVFIANAVIAVVVSGACVVVGVVFALEGVALDVVARFLCLRSLWQ
jgi:hypothetical protein